MKHKISIFYSGILLTFFYLFVVYHLQTLILDLLSVVPFFIVAYFLIFNIGKPDVLQWIEKSKDLKNHNKLFLPLLLTKTLRSLKYCFTLILILFYALTAHSQYISAHRGNALSAPENTLAAFKNALQAGADFIEVDVRTTKDGVLMIMHDANLERTTNGKGAFKLYDAKYLKTLSAGKSYSDSFENEKIPTLEETCQLISEWNASRQHKTHLYIDAKDVEPQPLMAVLKKYGLEENAVYYGSDDFLWRLSSVFEDAKLLPALKNKADIMAKFNKLKPFAFDASWLYLTKEIVDEIHQLGVKVFTDLLGPLDTEINYIKAREMGVDLIQTDRMLMVQKTLSMH